MFKDIHLRLFTEQMVETENLEDNILCAFRSSECLPNLEAPDDDDEEDVSDVRAHLLKNSLTCFLLVLVKNAVVMTMVRVTL